TTCCLRSALSDIGYLSSRWGGFERRRPGCRPAGSRGCPTEAKATKQGGCLIHEFARVARKFACIYRPILQDQPVLLKLNTRLELHRLALARQVVGACAVDLDGGERRRRLLDLAREAREQRFDSLTCRAQLAGSDGLSLGVIGVGGGTPAHREAVVLGAFDGV